MTGSLSVKQWFEKGLSLFEAAKYEDAIFAFDQALKTQPDLAEAWTNKGRLRRRLSGLILGEELASKVYGELPDAE